MIRRKLRNLYKRFAVNYLSNSSHYLESDWKPENNVEFNILRDFIDGTVTYKTEFINITLSKEKHKWVGAQYHKDKMFAIPNDETRILYYDDDIHYINNIKKGLFKWTGGCIWNDTIYCYPRTENSFLKIKDGKVEELPLTIRYEKEHHYSGVCTKEGLVYQPPRNTNHILKTDLKRGISYKIHIVDEKYKIRFRYCGSIIHPNGFIYFFPECDNKVIKLEPETDRWCYIGNHISAMCFNAKIGPDGNIYGFSANQKGIMKIDVASDKVQMIHEEICPGAYGTKYGIDGCLYSVPGDGSKIYKYDVYQDILTPIHELRSDVRAKYAGGVTRPDGVIICSPAAENFLLQLIPDKKVSIPDDVYNFFFVDNY